MYSFLSTKLGRYDYHCYTERKQKLRDFPNVSEKVAVVMIHSLSLCISSGAKQKRKWEEGMPLSFTVLESFNVT